jgi:hypothetical protein
MADIKKVSMKPVKYVFDTHHHGDHAYGNPLWTQAGAITFAYKGVAEEMRRYEPARWRADAARRKDVAELHRDTAEPPQQTFEETPFVIDDGSRRVGSISSIGAHARRWLRLPAERASALHRRCRDERPLQRNGRLRRQLAGGPAGDGASVNSFSRTGRPVDRKYCRRRTFPDGDL